VGGDDVRTCARHDDHGGTSSVRPSAFRGLLPPCLAASNDDDVLHDDEPRRLKPAAALQQPCSSNTSIACPHHPCHLRCDGSSVASRCLLVKDEAPSMVNIDPFIFGLPNEPFPSRQSSSPRNRNGARLCSERTTGSPEKPLKISTSMTTNRGGGDIQALGVGTIQGEGTRNIDPTTREETSKQAREGRRPASCRRRRRRAVCCRLAFEAGGRWRQTAAIPRRHLPPPPLLKQQQQQHRAARTSARTSIRRATCYEMTEAYARWPFGTCWRTCAASTKTARSFCEPFEGEELPALTTFAS
jgi:hypothetical protein